MQRMWRVNASGNVDTTYQYKVNAGATTIVSRAVAKASLVGPTNLQTNIAVPTIASQKSALHFLPDRVLVRDGKRFSDVSYESLETQAAPVRFTETERPPSDAQMIDTTWQYVNVKGGPDRRFNNNRQLPVMQYGELYLTSSAGLSWILQLSQPALVDQLLADLQAAPPIVSQLGAPKAEEAAG
jgi:hypothetical protein